MDRRPPDHFDEVLRQVEDALDNLRLADGPKRDALLNGVREALEELGPDGLGVIELEATLSDLDDAPSVRVVDGGRDPEGPPSPGSKPDLRVADPSAADASVGAASAEGSDPLGFDAESPSVRVVRVTRRPEGVSQAGSVSLSSPDTWQTVFRGSAPRRYRIRCDRGAIHISLDGALVEELQPGQTSDFEGALIRAIARSSEGAEGTYWAIGESP
jgi:hypothetical protein